jgi:hypothetical protein
MARNVGKKTAASKTRIRTAIASFVDNKIDLKELERLINKIEQEHGAKDALKAYMDLIEYVIPKMARIEHTGKDGEKLTVEHMLSSLHSSVEQKALPVVNNSDILEIKPLERELTEYGE